METIVQPIIKKLEERPFFDTTYKFKDKEERSLFERFRPWLQNTYTAYFVTNEEMQYRTEQGRYFLEATKHLKYRFDELSFYQFLVVDEEMLDRNWINPDVLNGHRYLYVVSKETYDNKVTSAHKPNSIVHPKHHHARLFRSYENLVDHVESRCNGKNIFIVGKEALERMRYLITSIQLVITDTNIINNYIKESVKNSQLEHSKLLAHIDKKLDYFKREDLIDDWTNRKNEAIANAPADIDKPEDEFPLLEFETFLQFSNEQQTNQKVLEQRKKKVKKYFNEFIKFKVDQHEVIEANKSKNVESQYQYLLIQRKPTLAKVYEYTPGAKKQYNFWNVRVLKHEELAFIYDATNGSDKVTQILPWEEVPALDKLRNSNEDPYAINVTRSLLKEYSYTDEAIIELIANCKLQLLMR